MKMTLLLFSYLNITKYYNHKIMKIVKILFHTVKPCLSCTYFAVAKTSSLSHINLCLFNSNNLNIDPNSAPFCKDYLPCLNYKNTKP